MGSISMKVFVSAAFIVLFAVWSGACSESSDPIGGLRGLSSDLQSPFSS